MTKKILHSPDGASTPDEFLIPIEKDSEFILVGLSTGKEYEKGMVVFTGKELTPSMLMEKAEASQLPANMDLFAAYLNQIPSFKISKLVGIKAGNGFELEQA